MTGHSKNKTDRKGGNDGGVYQLFDGILIFCAKILTDQRACAGGKA